MKNLYAQQDITSGNRSVYAKRGELVTVFKEAHDNVWLCENERGLKFPCSPSKLGETVPVDVVVEIFEPISLFNQPKI